MLSKSQYVRGLQCEKSLWLHKKHPELKAEASAQQESLFNTGNIVGDYAKQLFPGGVEIAFTPDSFIAMAQKTSDLVEQGVGVIYEATFIENGIFIMVDILCKEADSWNIYEVKSSTSVKSVYVDDASV